MEGAAPRTDLAMAGAMDEVDLRAERDAAVREVVRLAGARCFAIAFDLLRDAAEAEDAVQEALARTCERYQDVRDPTALAGWVYRVLVNHCMRTLRRRRLFAVFRGRPSEGDVEEAPEPASEAPLLDEEIGRSIDARRLLAAVDRLPTMQRAAVLLRYGHEHPVDQVASLLGIGTESAKTHLKRGLGRLRAELAP